MRAILFALSFLAALNCLARPPDNSPHKVQFVVVDKNVRLEVLDWGGSGRSVVLLAGLGDTAHAFDEFAPKLTAFCHVYGITRRGAGVSSAPVSGYEADRLGDDVLAVLDSLRLDRPVLMGHSVAGEELSSVATRHPERIAGLIYLDAAYAFAYYSAANQKFFDEPRYFVDLADLRRKLDRLLESGEGDNRPLITELLATIPQFDEDLRQRKKELDLESSLTHAPAPPPAPYTPASLAPDPGLAIKAGLQKYTDIRVPVLAIYAIPLDTRDPAAQARESYREQQAEAFQKGVPQARVVRLPHAKHAVWRSNETEVLSEITHFLTSLP